MKNWLKENWFKFGILVVIVFLAVYSVIYFDKVKPTKEQQQTDQNQKTVAPNIDSGKEYSSPPNQNLSTTKVKNQLNVFEDYFEGILLDAYINCATLAAYNYFEKTNKDASFMASSFPEPKENYIAKCRSSYLSASDQGSQILVAEPPLVELRKKISSFLELVRTLGPLALEGQNETQAMEDQYKLLRTDIREEIVRLRKIY